MSRLHKPVGSVALLLALLFVVGGISGCSSPEQKAQAHYERGMELLKAKDFTKAGIEFKNALQRNEKHVGALRGLGQVEEHNSNWQAVSAILHKVVEVDPKDIDSRLRLARLLVLGNALDEAGKLLDAAGPEAARNSTVLGLRAAMQLKLNDPEGSVRTAQEAISIDPGNMEALMVLAAERTGRNDLDGALKLLNGAPAKEADQVGIQLFKLKLFEKMGDQAQVEGVLRKLTTLYPTEREFRRQLVKYYLQRKQPDAAEVEIRRMAKDNPTDTEAALDVVRFLNAAKGAAAARQELDTRIAAGGDVFPFQMMGADLDVATGGVAKARAQLEKLVQTTTGANTLAAQAKLAELLVASRDFAAADKVVDALLQKDERNAAGLKLRASIRLERGEYDAAIADFRQALHDQPRATDLMTLLAVVYERSGQIELADRQFADALRNSNSDPSVAINYATFLQRRGNAARAEELLADIATRRPSDTAVWSMLGQVRLARQDWAGAQQAADTLRKLNETSGMADQLLAASLGGQKKFDESIGVLQTAYASTPDSPRAIYALVGALMRAQKTDRAAAFLQTLLDKDPANADALVLMASVDLANNKPDEAIKRLQSAIEHNPKSGTAYRALAELQLRQNKTDDALKVLKAGLAVQSDSTPLKLTLAAALEKKGEFEAAIKEYEALAVEQPASMIISNNLASLLSDHRTDPASLERAHTLAAGLRKSEIPQFKDTLGWVNYRRGEFKEALPLLEDAVRQLPDAALARYHLGMTYLSVGDPVKAKEQFSRGLELSQSDAETRTKIEAALQKVGKT